MATLQRKKNITGTATEEQMHSPRNDLKYVREQPRLRDDGKRMKKIVTKKKASIVAKVRPIESGGSSSARNDIYNAMKRKAK